VKRFLVPLSLILPCFACINPQWHAYDESQFTLSMMPNQEAYVDHAEMLLKWSEGKELPPGLAAELGYYLALIGRTAEAEAMFAVEVGRHPECTLFVQALRRICLGADAEGASQPTPADDDEESPPSPGANKRPKT